MPETQQLSREEFLRDMDYILGLRPGTFRGDEKLEDSRSWDSTVLVHLLAEAAHDTNIYPDHVVGCSTSRIGCVWQGLAEGPVEPPGS